MKILLSLSLVLLPVIAQASLDLANAPLFVTAVLPPNLFLTPVYARGANEVSLLNMDWALGAGAANNNMAWNSYLNDYYGGYPHRVVPWPGLQISQNLYGSCVKLYGDDEEGGNGSIIRYPTNVIYGTLASNCTNANMNILGKAYANFVDIPPVNAGDLSFYNGMAEYARSNMNMLYYNDAQVYNKWPGFNGPDYSQDDTSKPCYHPTKTGGQLDLSSNMDYLFKLDTGWNASSTSCPNGLCKLNFSPGIYWIYDSSNNPPISDPGSYAQGKISKPSNFATWFTYWRSADLATRSILGNFVDQLANVSQDIGSTRLWLNFNDNFTLLYDPVVQSDVSVAFTAIYSSPALNGTLANGSGHDAVADFLSDHGQASIAFFDNPNAAYDKVNNPARSCRRNYQIIVTPDYTNLRWSYSTGKNGSNIVGTLPSKAPWAYFTADAALGSFYQDNYSGTWSDLGAAVWNTDLSAILSNTLLPTSTDPQTGQHLTLFLVGPAASGLVFPASVSSYDAALAILAKNPPSSWVDPRAQAYNNTKQYYEANVNPDLIQTRDQQASIDDLWHMVLNSRGFFYQSQNASGLTTGLLNALHDILVNNISGSSVSTSTTSLQTGARVYQATVESNWKGHLRSYSIVNQAKSINSVTSNVVTVSTTPDWDLAQMVSAQDWNGGRTIYTYDGASGVVFSWNNLSKSVQTKWTTPLPAGISDTNTYGNDLVNYLRGSPTCEDGASSSCSASGVSYVFRRRNIDRSDTTPYTMVDNPNGRNILGDISNSNPWYVTQPYAGMSDLDSPGYNAYRIANQNRPNVLYVGANDGMVHAVNAGNGNELFAYIPSLVLDNLPDLASLHYSHEYFSDGSPFSADVNLNGWKTVLAGGLNKGGKGYYLLDITDPTKFSAGSVLWEFTHADMNYSYNLPIAFPAGNLRQEQARQIVRMNDGKWAMIVGNGYPSDAGRQACLFVIYLAGPSGSTWTAGTDYREYCVGLTTYSDKNGLDTNGLSTPTPYDLNGDGLVDVIYAGDLNGNLWKFDVSSSDPTKWAVAYSGSPLFIAKNNNGTRQPIISPPEVALLNIGTTSGQLLLFGTGKYIATADLLNSDVQSFYGVWDRNLPALSGLDRSVLLQQVLTENGTSRSQNSANPVPYCTAATLDTCSQAKSNLGWYWDMIDPGERLTGRLTLLSGIIYFNTFNPVLDAAGEPDPCLPAGGWLMGLDAVNGYMVNTFPVFDTDQNGVVDQSDASSAGLKIGAAMGGTSFVTSSSVGTVGFFSPINQVNADVKTQSTHPYAGAGGGRVSWFELINN